jgi:hypothetical protein
VKNGQAADLALWLAMKKSWVLQESRVMSPVFLRLEIPGFE